jgi:hypothetical protein
MSVKNSISAVPLTNIASSTLTTSYLPINPNGLLGSCFLLRLTSTSTTGTTISFDGINDHDYIPSDGTININAQTNSQLSSGVAKFSASTIVYAKGTAGTGNIYLSGYYQSMGV